MGLAALPVLNVTDELLGAAQFVAWALLKKTATKVITDKFPSLLIRGNFNSPIAYVLQLTYVRVHSAST